MPVFRRLLNCGYLLLIVAVSPIVLYRMIVHGKYRSGWSEKLFGRLPARTSDAPCIWLHAVSVGEVLQLRQILDALRQRRPDVRFIVTTTTSTGRAVAEERLAGSDVVVCYFPLDFTWAVRRAITNVRPDAIVLVELELWPNFILEAERAGVPLALVNGRISEKSFRGYRMIRPLMKHLLLCCECIAVQTETYAERILALGAEPERVVVTGSIKFDGVFTDRNNPQTNELRESFGLDAGERVFVAGSTQAPEEELALDAWLTLRKKHDDLRLILVPRHKERFEEVARMIEAKGPALLRRSRSTATHPTVGRASSPSETTRNGDGSLRSTGSNRLEAHSTIPPVLLLDTLGELSACWGLADVAFVGGSLTRRGGQNMIEPAAYGAAVLFGPNTWNFRDVVELLLSRNAARVVTDGNELTAAVDDLLTNPDTAAQLGRTAQQLVLTQRGATGRTAEVVEILLPSSVRKGEPCPVRAPVLAG